jgi:hypothetical protein
MPKYPYTAWLVRFFGAILFFVGMAALDYSLWLGSSVMVGGFGIALIGNRWFRKLAGWRWR